MKKIMFLNLLLFASVGALAQTARLQVIHNSPDLAAQTVDVYVNGAIFIDDFEFRTATEFETVPAGVPLTIDIAPGNSTSVAQSLYDVTVTLNNGETYIAVANGIVSPTGYTNPSSFALNVFPQAREAALVATQTDVLINHGSPDAPTVDVVETGVGAGTIVNDISFPQFQAYLQLPVANYTLEVRDAAGTTTVAAFQAPLQTLGTTGAALTVLASGFLTPSNNSNGPAFGLFAVTADGGDFIPLPPVNNATARLQVIHNSPDLAAQTVDVYVNGAIFIDDFEFRTATEFETVPAGVPLTIDIAPGNSTSVAQSLYDVTVTLNNGETYIAVANGIVSPTGYTNPSSFALNVFPQAREAALVATQTDVLVNHGSPDAPTVDVVETGVGAGTIVNDISFPQFQGYLQLPVANYTLEVRDAAGTTTVAAYQAPLQTLGTTGAALTVLASGFLTPSNNSNGPAFGLFATTAGGGALIPLPPVNLNTAQFLADQIVLYPNPSSSIVNLSLPESLGVKGITITDLQGRTVRSYNNNVSQIDVSDLTSGMYMVSIQTETANVHKRILVD